MHFPLKCTFIFFFIPFSLFWYFYFYRFCKMGNNLGISHLSIGLRLFLNWYCILYMWKCHHPMLCYRTQIRCLIIVMASMLMDNNIYCCFNTNMEKKNPVKIRSGLSLPLWQLPASDEILSSISKLKLNSKWIVFWAVYTLSIANQLAYIMLSIYKRLWSLENQQWFLIEHKVFYLYSAFIGSTLVDNLE